MWFHLHLSRNAFHAYFWVDRALDFGLGDKQSRRLRSEVGQLAQCVNDGVWENILHQLRHSALTHAAEDGTNTADLACRPRHALSAPWNAVLGRAPRLSHVT